jgi:hypothetical protein
MYFPKSNKTLEVCGETIINPGITVKMAIIEGMIMYGVVCVIPKISISIKANRTNSIK